jgi:hypothetical protein
MTFRLKLLRMRNDPCGPSVRIPLRGSESKSAHIMLGRVGRRARPQARGAGPRLSAPRPRLGARGPAPPGPAAGPSAQAGGVGAGLRALASPALRVGAYAGCAGRCVTKGSAASDRPRRRQDSDALAVDSKSRCGSQPLVTVCGSGHVRAMACWGARRRFPRLGEARGAGPDAGAGPLCMLDSFGH